MLYPRYGYVKSENAIILHEVNKKKYVDAVGYWNVNDTVTKKLYFEAQRTVARKELAHSGNPPYDPSVYLDDKAWKLPS